MGVQTGHLRHDRARSVDGTALELVERLSSFPEDYQEMINGPDWFDFRVKHGWNQGANR